MISAKIILGSQSSLSKDKIATFLCIIPRIVLAEFNTHRMLTRNSASSRAIPFEKMLESVRNNPFIPMKWMKEHSGMQGTKFFEPGEFSSETVELPSILQVKQKPIIGIYHDALKNLWLLGRDIAAEFAQILNKIGLSKQFCNRLLEPWAYHTIAVTATEWENFFALRAHPAAEIHIQHLAYLMLEEYNKYEFQLLEPGQWHIPYHEKIKEQFGEDLTLKDYLHVSTMMLARTSYSVFDHDMSQWTLEKYHEKYNDMKKSRPMHASPFEHCNRTMNEYEYENFLHIEPRFHDKAPFEVDKSAGLKVEKGWCKNMRGFIQLRFFMPQENAKDDRLNNR